MKKNLRFNQQGYTLIELLTVMVVVVVVGVIIAGILVSSLRGGSKSNVLNNVRENGNYAIVQISKMITYAQAFNGVSDGTVDINGNLIYTTDCTQIIPPSPSPTPARVSYQYLKITSFDGGQTVFSCGNSTIASNGASLVDTSSVSVSACSFSCIQDNFGQLQTIGINFTLSQKTTSNLTEKNAAVPFQTSVRIRNNNL